MVMTTLSTNPAVCSDDSCDDAVSRLPWWQPLKNNGRFGMRRFVLLLSVIVVVLFGSFVAWGSGATAQAPFATPGPGEFEIAPGQIGRELAAGLLEEPPAAPVYLALLRFTTEPGSVFTTPTEDPTAALILVESGEVTVRLEGPVMITRTTGPEEAAAGTDFTLGPGESFLWPPHVAGEIRNDGQESVVTLVAFLAPAEDEAATPLAGTPTP
jgi:quercetin dioxygenase-like cupin family protein